MTNLKASSFRKVGHVVKGSPTNPFANLYEVFLIKECANMAYEYYTTCNCCGTDEDVEIHNTESGQKALCPVCADLRKYTDMGVKAAKMQQAEDRLIGVIRGEKPNAL